MFNLAESLFFEATSKKHLDYNHQNENLGEPKDLATLFSIDEIKSDFENFEHKIPKSNS